MPILSATRRDGRFSGRIREIRRSAFNCANKPYEKAKLATRLTQRTKREAKDSEVPEVRLPKAEHGCAHCGARIRAINGRSLYGKCGRRVTLKNFCAGRNLAHKPEHYAKMSATMRAHRRAINNWKASEHPAWFTRDVYLNQIIPAITNVPKAKIRKALGVSEPYSIYIQSGKAVSHKRHWEVLADRAGVKS